MFGTRLADNRKSRRKVDDAGKPFPPPRSKHEPYAGMFRHPEERYRFGSIMGRGPGDNTKSALRRPSGNPAVTFTPSPEFAKADWSKAVKL